MSDRSLVIVRKPSLEESFSLLMVILLHSFSSFCRSQEIIEILESVYMLLRDKGDEISCVIGTGDFLRMKNNRVLSNKEPLSYTRNGGKEAGSEGMGTQAMDREKERGTEREREGVRSIPLLANY